MHSFQTTDRPSRAAGFTLVELAIVLCVIGLVIGSVVAGTALVEAGKIRAMINDVDKYRAAVSSFQTKYGYYPGDIPTAEVSQFWPGETGGNGNGRICSDAWEDENFRAWRHLALASMIEGTYTGTHSSFRGVIDVNMPASAIEGMGVMFHCLDNTKGNFWVLALEMPVLSQQQPVWTFTIGRIEDAAHDGTWVVTSDMALTTRQALEIDTKADDGFPASGQVHGGALDHANAGITNKCSTSTAPLSPDGVIRYNVNYLSGVCRVAFLP